MACLRCCDKRDDPDAFIEGRLFCRGWQFCPPCTGGGRLAPSACAATVPLRKSTRLDFVDDTRGGDVFSGDTRGGNVFSGDTRPRHGSDSEPEAGAAQNRGHTDFVGEKARDIVADGLQRFTTNKVAPPQPDWIRLADNVVSVLGQNPGVGQLNGTNCYIVGTGKKRLLIDAGEFGAADKFIPIFQDVMQDIGCEGLQEILITHMHHDHFGCIRQLQELYGPNIPVGKIPSSDDVFYTYESLKSRDLIKYLEDDTGQPRYKAAFKSGGWDVTGIPAEEDIDWGGTGAEWDKHRRSKLQIVMQYPFVKTTYQFYKQELGSLYPFHRLSDDDVIVTQGATLRVVQTPGHSEDHAAFYLVEENALFSGDHVLGFGTTFVQDMFKYVHSLHKMLALKPLTLFPGHGPCIDEGEDYLQRYITHRKVRIDQIYSTLQKNGGTRALMTAREIADILYTKTSDAMKQQAVQNCVQNLTFLVKEGRAHGYEYNAEGALRVLDFSTVGFNGPPPETVFGLSKMSAKM